MEIPAHKPLAQLELSRRSLLKTGAGFGGLAALTGPILSACGTSENGATRQAVLKVGAASSGSAGKLNPLAGSGGFDRTVLLNSFDSLARVIDGQIQNELATSFEPNSDATKWIIKLRNDVTFHDGRKLTADDVIFSIRAFADLKKSSVAVLYSDVDLVNLRKIDTYTVEMPVKRPRADIVESVLGVVGYVFPDQTVDLSSAVGSGPFKLQSYTAQSALLVANQDYWAGAPALARIEVQGILDPQARLNAVTSRQLDYAIGIPAVGANVASSRSDIQVIRSPISGASIMEFVMNPAVEPFNNPQVRRAFRLACNRKALVDTALFGAGQSGADLPGEGLPGYDASAADGTYDPDQARQLLAAAGVKNAVIRASDIAPVPGLVKGAELYAQQLAAVGVKLTVETVPADSFFSDIKKVLNAPLQTYSPTNQPVGAVISAFTGRHAFLRIGSPENPTYDRLLEEAQGTVDAKQRGSRMNEVQARYVEEGGHLIWGYAQQLNAAARSVKGIQFSFSNILLRKASA